AAETVLIEASSRTDTHAGAALRSRRRGFFVQANGVSSMSLKTQVQDDMKAAMRARDTARLSAVRLLLAAIKQREVDERIELDDAGVMSVVEKLVKQRRDAAEQYDKAARAELAAAERFEIEVLSTYLP